MVHLQALGGPTRSQKANLAWADAAAKMRNPNAVPRAVTPPTPNGSHSPYKHPIHTVIFLK